MRTNDRIRPPNASFGRELPRTPPVSAIPSNNCYSEPASAVRNLLVRPPARSVRPLRDVILRQRSLWQGQGLPKDVGLRMTTRGGYGYIPNQSLHFSSFRPQYLGWEYSVPQQTPGFLVRFSFLGSV